jgi:hypothetical protein
VLLPITSFWEALPGVLAWITGGAEAPRQPVIAPGGAEVAIRSRALPLAIPARARGLLEIIRFAAANRLCVELLYDGTTRLIEPYSLRRTSEGHYVLHAIRRRSGEHRSYRVDRVQGASVSSEPFTPRYLVELTSEGPLVVMASAAGSAAAPAHRPAWPPARPSRATRKASGPTYVYRCSWCKKTFERKHMDGTLRAHENRTGYPCGGRMGVFVKTRH